MRGNNLRSSLGAHDSDLKRTSGATCVRVAYAYLFLVCDELKLPVQLNHLHA